MQHVIRFRDGKWMSLEQPVVMGIINVTPDSFYDGGRLKTDKLILEKAEQMISEGAGILDVGGCSTRPNASFVPEEEEISRVVPSISLIKKRIPEAVVSVDTFRSQVARSAISSGADMVNDVSGGDLDPEMFDTISELGCPYILMHMRGNPTDMQDKAKYEFLCTEVLQELQSKLNKARLSGIKDVIVDPGFGFAKTLDQNYVLLRNLNYISSLNCPILVGFSRKSMAYKLLGISPEEALNATTVLNTIALTKGASILRVHDVKEAVQCIAIWDKLRNSVVT